MGRASNQPIRAFQDLTSPSANKYRTIFSDKKTSTPNRTTTPSRCSREQRRRRPALCKKNIAKDAAQPQHNLLSDLAALNELVDSEQARQTHQQPPVDAPRNSKGATLFLLPTPKMSN